MPTQALIAPSSQRLWRLALSGLGWAFGFLGLGGCDARNPELIGFYFPYSVVVEDFRSPCPAKCSTLPFSEYEESGHIITFLNYDDPYVLGDQAPESGQLDFLGPTIVPRSPWWSRICSLGKDCDCDLQLSVEARPTVSLLNLRIRPLSGRNSDYILNFTPSAEDDDWNFELIGEFPMPLPASDYDPAYEQQEFHLVGYPDEYIEAEPDSCTDDLRSLRFDLRLTPLLPYHMQ